MLQLKGMDQSRIATSRAGRRIALAASVAAHALVAGLWLHTPPRQPGAQAPSRARAPMAVRLYSAPPRVAALPAALATPPEPLQPPRAKASRPRVRAATPAQPPQPTAVEAPPAAAAPPIAPSDPVAPTAAPGSAFAGMFAPIISRPIGNSAWGRRRADPPPALDPQVQREQALLALRMSLLGRLNDLAGRLGDSGQGLKCDIAIDALNHTAEVQCADPADQGTPWSALQGLLLAGTVPITAANLCFRLIGTQVSSEPCAEEPRPANP